MKRKPDNGVKWVTQEAYSWRCAVCGAPAWVQAMEEDYLCRQHLKERRKLKTRTE